MLGEAGTLDRRFWSCPGPAGYKLRAANYIKVWHKRYRICNKIAQMCLSVCLSLSPSMSVLA